MSLIQIVTSIFKDNLLKFPGQMPTDNAKLAAEIKKWESEFTLKNVTPAALREIRIIIEKDSRFVSKPAEISDYFAVKLLMDTISELGNDDRTIQLIDEVKKINTLFDHRYGFRWKLKTLKEETERLCVWIKDLKLYNVDPGYLEAAGTWLGTKSDYNRYAPTVQEFVLACRMAMIGENVPSPLEAYLIVTGSSKRKSHPLVDWTMSQVKNFESKNNKAIPKDTYMAIYQDALYEFGTTGEIPKTQKQTSNSHAIDKSDIMEKESLLILIQNLKLEILHA